MKTKVTVVDFGASNLLSVYRGLAHVGAEVEVASTPKAIAAAPRLVLPGVGAFPAAMAGLRDRGLVEPVIEFCATGRPFLGICIGLQMMMEASEELGETTGLGLIRGRVSAIPGTDKQGGRLKIPHVGWNTLRPPNGAEEFATPLLDGIGPADSVYFVHSFAAQPAEPAAVRAADTIYGGFPLCAVIAHDNLMGCQFHPEKSGVVGLRILENFLALA